MPAVRDSMYVVIHCQQGVYATDPLSLLDGVSGGAKVRSKQASKADWRSGHWRGASPIELSWNVM